MILKKQTKDTVYPRVGVKELAKGDRQRIVFPIGDIDDHLLHQMGIGRTPISFAEVSQ